MTTNINNITLTTTRNSNPLFSPPMKPILDTKNVIYISPKRAAETRTSAVADVFGRPMDPGPSPLVYLNGGPGVGKEAVAECLVLLLGQDKSLLVDVRGVGWDDDDVEEDKYKSALMTPENPGYFDYDNNTNHKCPGQFSSTSHPPSTSHSALSASPPCIGKKLARLLDRPGNTFRIAILEFCAFDTPAGHAALSTFAAAARLAGRLFIPIALTCEPAEQMRRAQSLQRQCSYKNRRTVSMPVGIGGVGGGRPANSSFSFGGNINGGDGSAVRNRQSQAVQQQLPLACPIVSSAHGYGGVECDKTGSRTRSSDGGGVASNNGYELTVDITKTSSFETALQIVELVKMLAAGRDAAEQR